MKFGITSIVIILACVLLAFSGAADNEKAGLHPPGDQRPLLGELKPPAVGDEEMAAFAERMKAAAVYTDKNQLLTLLMVLVAPVVGLTLIYSKTGKRLYRLFKQRHSPTIWITSFLFAAIAFVGLVILEAIRVYIAYKGGLIFGSYWSALGAKISVYFALLVALTILVALLFRFLKKSTRLWWILTTLIVILVSLALGALYPHRLPLSGVVAEAIVEGPAVDTARTVSESWDGSSMTLFEDSSGIYSGQIWATGSVFSDDILISRGALAELTPFELEVLIAEEEAYRQAGYNGRMYLVITFIVLIVLFVSDLVTPYFCRRLKTPPPPDSRSLPIMLTAVLIGFILLTPFAVSYNRQLEAKAARIAIENTRKPMTAVELYRKQATYNLSAAQPNGVLHLLIDPHRATADKIAQARTMRQDRVPPSSAPNRSGQLPK